MIIISFYHRAVCGKRASRSMPKARFVKFKFVFEVTVKVKVKVMVMVNVKVKVKVNLVKPPPLL